jgi:hypothetical protein
MAHFFNPIRPYDEHYEEGHGASVAVQGGLILGLWAGDPNLTSQFVVQPRDQAIASIQDGAVPFADRPDLRYYTITGMCDGETRIEAKLGPDGPIWAWMPLTVGLPGTRTDGNAGQIVFVGGLAVGQVGTKADFLRNMYNSGAEAILEKARGMVRDGQTEEEVARWVVETRNSLKQEVRSEGPYLFKKIVEYRNMKNYGNTIGPDYAFLRNAGKTDAQIIEGVINTSGEFNRVGGRLRLVGTVGEVVGFALTATQNSPAALPPLPVSEQEKVQIEAARIRFHIPASANIDKHGHLKKGYYLQVDVATFDPHTGDEMASETEEILWALGVNITYHYAGVTWTVPGR